MTVNNVDHSHQTPSPRVDSYAATGRGRNGIFAGPKDLGNEGPQPPTTDRASISEDAHRLAALRRVVDAGRAALAGDEAPRAARLVQVRERLASGFYHSAEVRDQVAEKISAYFFDGPLY
jgi:hypothetical protein